MSRSLWPGEWRPDDRCFGGIRMPQGVILDSYEALFQNTQNPPDISGFQDGGGYEASTSNDSIHFACPNSQTRSLCIIHIPTRIVGDET